MKAVHFGAGNIGRGFVGFLLHRAGYELVFADVADGLIEQLDRASSYTVHEVGPDAQDHEVTGYRAINSAQDPERLTAELADADLVTTAVGAHILRFVAPNIAAGIAARPADAPRLAVLACENAINATDLLAQEIRAVYTGDDLEAKALFADTAVDRIVPAQDPAAGLDVTVESFFEWAVESGPFDGDTPGIPGITWVDDLEPYIERKLFTVNTGHATTAYVGHRAGRARIAEAIGDPEVRPVVERVLAETSALLVAKHGFSEETQQQYAQKILARFENDALPDTTARVGRAPLRKLSRHDRFIGPAAELAERDLPRDGLLEAIGAALDFTAQGDAEAAQLQQLLGAKDPEEVTADITGLEPDHPLFAEVVEVVRRYQQG